MYINNISNVNCVYPETKTVAAQQSPETISTQSMDSLELSQEAVKYTEIQASLKDEPFSDNKCECAQLFESKNEDKFIGNLADDNFEINISENKIIDNFNDNKIFDINILLEFNLKLSVDLHIPHVERQYAEIPFFLPLETFSRDEERQFILDVYGKIDPLLKPIYESLLSQNKAAADYFIDDYLLNRFMWNNLVYLTSSASDDVGPFGISSDINWNCFKPPTYILPTWSMYYEETGDNKTSLTYSNKNIRQLLYDFIIKFEEKSHEEWFEHPAWNNWQMPTSFFELDFSAWNLGASTWGNSHSENQTGKYMDSKIHAFSEGMKHIMQWLFSDDFTINFEGTLSKEWLERSALNDWQPKKTQELILPENQTTKDINPQSKEKTLAYRENMRQWFSDFFIKFDKTSHKEWFDNGHDTDKSRKAWINRVYNNKKNTV